MSDTFTLDDAQTAKFHAWAKEHRTVCTAPLGAIGGRLTVSFTPTSIGEVAKVSCSCGAEIDLTDYESW